MEAAGDKADEEGVQIALELIDAIKTKYIQPGNGGGIRGFHLMAARLGGDRATHRHRGRVAARRICTPTPCARGA